MQKAFPSAKNARVFPALDVEAFKDFWELSFSTQKTPPSQFMKNRYILYLEDHGVTDWFSQTQEPRDKPQTVLIFCLQGLCVKLFLTVLFLVWDAFLSREPMTLLSHACLAFFV